MQAQSLRISDQGIARKRLPPTSRNFVPVRGSFNNPCASVVISVAPEIGLTTFCMPGGHLLPCSKAHTFGVRCAMSSVTTY